jgi:fibro-slime domain-containing protein
MLGLAIASCSSASVMSGGEGGNDQGGMGGGGKGGSAGNPGGGSGGFTISITIADAGIDRPGGGNCGDGVIERSEQCDDGNTESGDGCSRICQIENNYECPEQGKPCINLAKCGNGILTSDETCDDGNTQSDDGCSDDCKTLEPGWQCRVPGKPCTPRCGDGTISGTENCDDGNADSGDGCSATCHLEIGFKCDGKPSKCTKTTCGDGKKEGAEGCDDGNAMPFDGCSADCQKEPNCSGESCTSECGDGIVMNEECDDSNAASGDGCSKDCKKEPGWTCKQPELGDKMLVPVIYRDFKFQKPSDFEAGVTGQEKASVGMVEKDLDKDGKPVYTGVTGGGIHVESKDTFAQWFRNTKDVNHATAAKLVLWKNESGAYVNRYGANGEQWYNTEPAYYCGNVGAELTDADGKAIPCTSKYATSTDCDKKKAEGKEMLKCFAEDGSYKATYIVSKVDGNPLFFPVDGDNFSPASEAKYAQVPPLYDPAATWPKDVDENGKDRLHNFSFTSEVRYWFKYESGKTYKLDFVGDDDVWVFINKKLAVDLGGIHSPVPGNVDVTKLSNLKPGNVYEAVVFQAERQTTGSSYQLTLSGFNAAPTSCVPTCGDGVTVADEECDRGKENNDDEYGGCTTQCKWGGFCGDGIVNGKEDCDNGKENGTQYGSGGCTIGCTTSHFCGDGKADTDRDEECDLADKNGVKLDNGANPSTEPNAQIYCTTECKIPPGIVY